MFVLFLLLVFCCFVFSSGISGGPISLSSLFGIDCLLPHFVMSWLVRTLTCKQHIFSFFHFFSSGICGLLASNVSNVFFCSVSNALFQFGHFQSIGHLYNVFSPSCLSSGLSGPLANYLMFFFSVLFQFGPFRSIGQLS